VAARAVPLCNVNPFSPERRNPRRDASKTGRQVANAGSSLYRNDFEEISRLGKGAFGEVYLCRRRIDGWRYAVKKLGVEARRIHGPATGDAMLQEVYALAAYGDHPHIVSYHRYC
jgi:serine/threonine protein kinase